MLKDGGKSSSSLKVRSKRGSTCPSSLLPSSGIDELASTTPTIPINGGGIYEDTNLGLGELLNQNEAEVGRLETAFLNDKNPIIASVDQSNNNENLFADQEIFNINNSPLDGADSSSNVVAASAAGSLPVDDGLFQT